jgi:hypothetical protein
MIAAIVASIALIQPAPVKKVLVIGIDGCRPDALARAATPNIDRLVTEGCYAVGRADPLTVSGPCWSSILCGVWSGKHGVRDNSFVGANYGEYPDFVTLLERARPELQTVVVTSWSPISEQIVANADYEGPKSGKGDEAAVYEVRSQLRHQEPDVVFVHFDAPDYAGHSFGYGPEVPEYIKSIEETDALIGVIIAQVRDRNAYSNEEWLVIVTSDHGGTGKGHGLPIPEHIEVPFVVSGPSAARSFGVVPTQCDVAPTVFAFFGIEPGPEVDWDGVPVGLKGVDSKALSELRDRRIVTFDPPSGLVVGQKIVRMEVAEPGLEIRFTADKKVPTVKSMKAGGIMVSADTFVRARAFKDGRPVGPSSCAYYQVQGHHLAGLTTRPPETGLQYRVVEGVFKSVDDAKFTSPIRQGVVGRPSEKVGGAGENFALEFTGFVSVEEDGIYQVGLYSDDGARVTIGERTVVDHDGLHGASMKTGLVALRAGWHEIRIVYFQAGGEATLSLAMGKQGAAMEEVGSSRFAHRRTGP